MTRMPPAIVMRRLAAELPRYRYAFRDEAQLHAGLAIALQNAGLSYYHEYPANERDRFDFLVEGAVVIEAKIGGTLPEALRQVRRYCANDIVEAVAVVTIKPWGGCPVRELQKKPIAFIELRRQAF